MIKRVQNRIAGSRRTLPAALIYSLLVWAGVIITTPLRRPYAEIAAFLATIYLLTLLDNKYALIRAYTRTVTGAWIVLMCAAAFLLPSLRGAVVSLCFAAFLLILFGCYQDKESQGKVFFAFLPLAFASLAWVQILFFVPLLWLIMAARLYCLTLRSFFSSLLALALPYWFIMIWLLFDSASHGYSGPPLMPIADHFTAMAAFEQPLTVIIPPGKIAILAFVTLLVVIGSIHCILHSFNDSIRVRQCLSVFIILSGASLIFIILQPQHFDFLLRLLIIGASPLIAHFVTLTHTKLTNIVFIAVLIIALIFTVINLWLNYMMS